MFCSFGLLLNRPILIELKNPSPITPDIFLPFGDSLQFTSDAITISVETVSPCCILTS